MEIVETVDFLFKKDLYSMILVVISLIVSFTAFFVQIKRSRRSRRTVYDIILELEVETSKIKLESLELPEEERKEIQEKLAQLDGDNLAELNQYGVLSLLYFVLSSMGNFQTLMELKNAKSAMY